MANLSGWNLVQRNDGDGGYTYDTPGIFNSSGNFVWSTGDRSGQPEQSVLVADPNNELRNMGFVGDSQADGNFARVPLSIAQQNGLQIEKYAARDPKYDSGSFLDNLITNYAPMAIAAMAAGPIAQGLGGGILGGAGAGAATSAVTGGNPLLGAISGGIGPGLGAAGVPQAAIPAASGAIGAALSGGNPLLGAAMGASRNVFSFGPKTSLTDNASSPEYASAQFQAPQEGSGMDWNQLAGQYDFGTGGYGGGYDTSFLNDPAFAGGYDFNSAPTYADYYGTGGYDPRTMGYPINLGNSSQYMQPGSADTGTSSMTGLLKLLGIGAGFDSGGTPSSPAQSSGTNLNGLLGAGLGGLLGMTAANSKPAGSTTSIQDVTDWQKPYIQNLLNSASTTFQQQQGNPTGANISNAGANQVQSTINGDYLNSNPYLDQTYNKAARGLVDQYQYATAPGISKSFGHMQAFGGSPGFGEAMGKAQQGLATGLSDLGTSIYGGNYQQERSRQAAAGMGAQDYSQSYQAAPYANLNAYGNIAGRSFGSQTTEPYFNNPTGGLLFGSLGGYALSNMFGGK